MFILDVDGVMTTGHFLYSAKGKEMKIFGPDDNDGLSLIKRFIKVIFVTGDKKGFKISQRRIQKDMNYELYLVSTIKRIEWIKKNFPNKRVVYMGDGIFDHYVMKKVFYSIAPNNADKLAKNNADFITERDGGSRAVAEACLHLLDKFFEKYDPLIDSSQTQKIGEWTV